MTLAQITHHMATDSAFASQLQHDPENVLQSTYPHLSGEEIAAIAATLRSEDLDTLCSPDLATLEREPWWSPEPRA